MVPLITVDENPDNEIVELFCTRSGVMATGIRTADGFVVKKGSTIADKLTKSCPEYVSKKRIQCKELIDVNFVLKEDILFNTSSGAAAFVCGSSANGNVEWKTSDGMTLKDFEANQD